MARWDEDRYDYEPRRGDYDERGYGSREGLRGAGRRGRNGDRWARDRNGRAEWGDADRDRERGRDYERRYGYGDPERGEYRDPVTRGDGGGGYGGYGGYGRDSGDEGHGREPGYHRGDRYGFDEGRVTFERRGEHYGRGPKGWTRSNDRIRDDICERMAQHGRLDASNIEIEVDDGEVTLNGTVESRMEKRLAEDIADSVSGVRDVHNRLTVQRETTAGARQNREERTQRGTTEA